MTYYYSPNNELSQGDILRRIRVITNVVGRANNEPRYGESSIVIISHDCEIDKPLTIANSVLVARIARVLSQKSERIQENIRNNELLNTFHLPAEGQLMEESYIDWRTVQQTSKEMLKQLRNQQEYYRCTLDEKIIIASLVGFRDFLTNVEGNEQRKR